ncbi:UNVERIFIED_CONTAM: hypothetical protein RKD43_006706 [Streptomyces graminofaciens]
MHLSLWVLLGVMAFLAVPWGVRKLARGWTGPPFWFFKTLYLVTPPALVAWGGSGRIRSDRPPIGWCLSWSWGA